MGVPGGHRRIALAIAVVGVLALDAVVLSRAAPPARAALAAAAVLPVPSNAPTPTASPAPVKTVPAARPERVEWVRVAVANVWQHRDSARHVDRPSLLAKPDMRRWLRRQTLAQRLDLDSRLMTQVLRGEQVFVLSTARGFAQVRIPDQTGSAFRHGIIGWVAGRQLSSTRVAHAALSQHPAGSQRPAGVMAVRNARRYLGVHYLWAGMSSYGIDCSGLTYRAFQAMGITLPRDAADQSKIGRVVSKRDLRPGDLVFFGPAGWRTIHHVGIYAGHGLVLHAPHTGSRVTFTPLSAWRDYWGARRITDR